MGWSVSEIQISYLVLRYFLTVQLSPSILDHQELPFTDQLHWCSIDIKPHLVERCGDLFEASGVQVVHGVVSGERRLQYKL